MGKPALKIVKGLLADVTPEHTAKCMKEWANSPEFNILKDMPAYAKGGRGGQGGNNGESGKPGEDGETYHSYSNWTGDIGTQKPKSNMEKNLSIIGLISLVISFGTSSDQSPLYTLACAVWLVTSVWLMVKIALKK